MEKPGQCVELIPRQGALDPPLHALLELVWVQECAHAGATGVSAAPPLIPQFSLKCNNKRFVSTMRLVYLLMACAAQAARSATGETEQTTSVAPVSKITPSHDVATRHLRSRNTTNEGDGNLDQADEERVAGFPEKLLPHDVDPRLLEIPEHLLTDAEKAKLITAHAEIKGTNRELLKEIAETYRKHPQEMLFEMGIADEKKFLATLKSESTELYSQAQLYKKYTKYWYDAVLDALEANTKKSHTKLAKVYGVTPDGIYNKFGIRDLEKSMKKEELARDPTYVAWEAYRNFWNKKVLEILNANEKEMATVFMYDYKVTPNEVFEAVVKPRIIERKLTREEWDQDPVYLAWERFHHSFQIAHVSLHWTSASSDTRPQWLH
ncbi:hypothetical protein PsorP6_016240 [Peronosclerospora sorghi]|uniref:Uncharacterized protein n=1 Tax=Peronosclerospora sorghi TaxID=230839 RepID=A0ACC0VRK3_9STRA|nr:hypothetical protein PsorP6_016240 [Peronosclerospora sorghi]